MEDEDLVNDVDPELQRLEEHHAARQAKAAANGTSEDEEFEDVSSSTADTMETATDFLKSTGVLLEYISDPILCRTITKREREVIHRHLEALYKLTDSLEETIEELRDIEEDDEEDE